MHVGRLKPVTMLILSVVTSSRAYGGVNQWTTNGPPFAANHVVVDPSLPGVVYTEAGRTADGGLTWQPNNLSGLLESVAAGPSGTVYVGTGIDSFGLLFKSLDAGVTWGSIPFANSVTETFFLRVDPTVPSTVYAATATKPFPNGAVQYSVRKSTDGASTWSSCGGDFFLRTLAIDPLNASTLYAGGSKSTDGCATWRPLPNFPPDPYAIAIDPAKPATVYAANFSGIFKSTDGGESFAAISAGLTNLFVTALVIDPKNPSRLYAGTQGGGVFASTSAGVSWKAMNDGLTDLRIRELAIDPSGRFLHASATSAVFDLEVVVDPGVLTLYRSE